LYTTGKEVPLSKFLQSFQAKALIGGLAIAGFIAFRTIAIVPAGHVAVVDLFGNVDHKVREPGLHFINPFAHIRKFSTKTQILSCKVQVPSKEGLSISLHVSALFRVEPGAVRTLYTTVGTDYVDVILDPQFQSVIRQVTSGYEAKDLYNAASRTKMQHELIQVLRSTLHERGIAIEDTPLRGITLPETLTTAIENKLKAEQESQRMQFVLERERLEAERKQIEANGIASFQRIVSDGISPQLLKWKGIEATEHLASSPNSKIIVIGGSDGLPLILNAKQ